VDFGDKYVLPVAGGYAVLLGEVAEHAGRGRVPGMPGRLVLSVPAGWGEERKGVLRAAAAEAGLPEPVFVTGPVATAWHLAAGTKRGRFVAVVDAGEGSVDVAVLRRVRRGFELVGGAGGVHRFGGGQQDAAARRAVAELAGLMVGAGVSADELSGVYVTGRASRDPEVTRVIAETLGIQPRPAPDPASASASGAVESVVTREGGRTAAWRLRRLRGVSRRAALTAAAAMLAVLVASTIAVRSLSGTGTHNAHQPSMLPPGQAGVYVIRSKPYSPALMTPIDPSDNATARAINVGRARQIVFAPKGDRAYLVGRQPAPVFPATATGITLTPFDTATDTLGRPLLLPGQLNSDSIAFAPDGQTAYVVTAWYRGSNSDTSAVTPVNTVTNTGGRSIEVPGTSDNIAITPDGKTLYVTNPGSGTTGTPGWVIPITAATGRVGKEISVGDNPGPIAITTDGKTAYVINTYSSSVTPIKTATNTTAAPIHVCLPQEVVGDIAMALDGKTAYVLCSGSNDIYSGSVTPISTATDTAGAAIPVQGNVLSITISPDGTAAYVLSSGTSSSAPGDVTHISTATNTAAPPVTVGWDPGDIAFAPDGKTAYVDGSPTENVNPKSPVSMVTPINVQTNTAGHPITVTGYVSDIAAKPSSG
jgi:DNA-binding beta-propeller fold protein YncE